MVSLRKTKEINSIQNPISKISPRKSPPADAAQNKEKGKSKNKVLRKYSKSREDHNSCLRKTESSDTATDI